MSEGYASAIASRLADLVAAVTTVAVELKHLDRRNVLLQESIAAGERHHQEQRAQMAELRDAKLVEYINDYLDAFEVTLLDRHLTDVFETFRAFRSRTGEDGTVENETLLARLEHSVGGRK